MVEDKEALLAEMPEATNPEFNMFAADGVAPPEGHAVDITAKAAAGEGEGEADAGGDSLAFVNVTSAGTQGGEDEPAVAAGSAGSMWARVVTHFQSAKVCFFFEIALLFLSPPFISRLTGREGVDDEGPCSVGQLLRPEQVLGALQDGGL